MVSRPVMREPFTCTSFKTKAVEAILIIARYDVPAREQTDVRWAQTCMTLEDTVEQLGAQLSPVLVRRMQDKLWQALYFGYDYAAPFLPQLEKNLHWLDAEFAKLTEYQQKRNNASK